MEVKVNAENCPTERDIAETLGDFKNLPEEKRKSTLDNIFAFIAGVKIGAKLSGNSDKATA